MSRGENEKNFADCGLLGVSQSHPLEKNVKNPLTNFNLCIIILTESEVNIMRKTYTVYDNRTGKTIFWGFWEDVKDYLGCEGRYSVVRKRRKIISKSA